MRLAELAKVLTRCFPALLILSVAASPAQNADTADKVFWGRSQHQCRIGCDVESVTAYAGEPVDVNVTIENAGKSNVQYARTLAQPLSQFEFSGKSQTDKDCAATAFAKLRTGVASDQVCELEPGHKLRIKLRINRMLDLTSSGTYSAVIRYRFIGVPSTDDLVTVASNPITVKILYLNRDLKDGSN